MRRAIGYYRVSTGRQGRSGLGLDAQQKAVRGFARLNGFKLVDEFVEVESGAVNNKHLLKSALEACLSLDAVLVIAKLDRLSRSVAFISALIEAKVDFKVVDNPYAEKFTLHILAAVAEKEREDIGSRTKAALQAAKRRGVILGKHGRKVLSKLNHREALAFAKKMRPVIKEITTQGITSVRAICAELNRLRVPTFRHHAWHPNTVHQLLKRLAKNK